jgi:hypothetical protein
MDAINIELPGSTITAVTVEGDRIRIRFDPALLIKTMTGSVERTKWRQSGELVFSGAELEAEDLPQLPALCAGGDVGENVYTYRDMVPVPLESRGRAHCDLRLQDQDRRIRIRAGAVSLVMEETPKYVAHIRPE